MPDISNIWPEWRATQKIGEGSYGRVYRCVRNEYGIESVCAVKVISIPNKTDGAENMRIEELSEEKINAYNDIVAGIVNEIKLLELLKNAPNIVSVDGYKTVKRASSFGWDIYIRMEYLQSFADYVSSNKLTQHDVLKMARDICSAVEACAEKGIIHRDIKPDNIFIDGNGCFKLGDFGVARKLEKTQQNITRKGTFAYMAPEVYRESQYDFRADIYSLGMVIYKLLNNNRDPFVDASRTVVTVSERSAALERRMNGEKLPPPAYASKEVAEIVIKACEFNPDDRYACIEDLKADIVAVIGEENYDKKSASVKKTSAEATKRFIKVFETEGGSHSEVPDPEESIVVHVPEKYTKGTAEGTVIHSHGGKTEVSEKSSRFEIIEKQKIVLPLFRENELPLPKKN